MAQKFADNYDMPLFETSATDDSEADHVEAIFMTIAHKLKNHKPMMTPSVYVANSSKSAVRLVTAKGEVSLQSWQCCF